MSDPFATVVTEPRYSLAVQEGNGLALSLLGPSGPAGPAGTNGAAGPNEVTTSTDTPFTGYIYGDGTNVGGATAGTSNSTANTIVLRDANGATDLKKLSVGTFSGGVPTGSYGTVSLDPIPGTVDGMLLLGSPQLLLQGGAQQAIIGPSGFNIASGTITTSQPLSLTQTWNAAGVTFKGIDVNVTDTSSASGSLLMNLRVGGNPYFSIEKDGSTRLYRTYSSSTNFERLNFKYTGTAFQIGTEKGTGGGVARPLEFQTDGTTRMTIGATGDVGIGTNNPSSKFSVDASSNTFAAFVKQSTDPGDGLRIFVTGGSVSRYALKIDNNVYSLMSVSNAGTATFLTTVAQKSSVVYDSGTAGTLFLVQDNFGGVFTGTQYVARFLNLSNQVALAITGRDGNVGIGTGTPSSKLAITGGDAEITDSTKGVILKSPDGTRYRITVANGGTLTVTALP